MNNNAQIVPTPRDVLNGRGQGVQRHPGNIKYRKLVFANKGLYAKCPRADKIKISRGIVAAIRQSGGKFLEHNERTDVYFDIGDKKATEKTSQALREGQKDIRKKMYKKEEGNVANSAASDEAKPFSNVTMPAEPEVLDKQLPAEDYSQYSLLVLEALYNSDRDLPAPPVAIPQAVQQQPPPLPQPAPVQNNINNDMYGVPNNAYMGASSAAMAMALDHFPAARMPAQAMPQPIRQQHVHQEPMLQQHLDRGSQFSLGRDLSNPSFRLTDMSMGSAFSIRQLVESCYNPTAQPFNRGTMDSVLSSGTIDMIRRSQRQLSQIEQMELDDLTPTPGEIDAYFDRNTADTFDRVSDMRFTDLSKERFTDVQDKGRSTDCSVSTKNTSYSDNSLMTGQSGASGGRDISSSDSDMAQLLLGLANDGRSDDSGMSKVEI